LLHSLFIFNAQAKWAVSNLRLLLETDFSGNVGFTWLQLTEIQYLKLEVLPHLQRNVSIPENNYFSLYKKRSDNCNKILSFVTLIIVKNVMYYYVLFCDLNSNIMFMSG
jgi:hypothetical protein